MIRQDEYDTVLNHDETFATLAALLRTDYCVVFAWTDGHGTQLDILMAYTPVQFGHLQRGMNSSTDLFVAVSSFGMFGFELNGLEKFPGYVGEKLGLGGHNETTAELAALINGVCRELEMKRK